ncbi:hypothetical protein [Amycolatopsis suaedae]|uniref:hypothetical protein n=1 Tax=Amycolatopsis suaedae TaxID=2510978 RepID=UPI0013EF4179|nr:hypothetical protein [Amycolatopsis suaedae]
MRKVIVTSLAVVVTGLGLALGLTGTTEGPSPIRPPADPMLVNMKGPICGPPCEG